MSPDLVPPLSLLARAQLLMARAQLLMLDAQVDPDSPTLAAETREVLYALAAHMTEIATENKLLCGIIHDLCQNIDRLTDRLAYLMLVAQTGGLDV